MKTLRLINLIILFTLYQYSYSYASSNKYLTSQFIPNQGQLDSNTFAIRPTDQSCSFFQRNKVVHQIFSFHDQEIKVVNLEFEFQEVCNDVVISKEQYSNTVTNFLYGDNPDQWYSGLKNFKSLVYSNMYEKIDLIYYSDANRLKSDIIVHPNGDLSKYKFKINGNIGVSVKDNGDLEISTMIGLMIERIPEAYQLIGNKKILVNLNYHIDNSGIVSLIVGKYDKNFDLIIDPELTFLSYCGGSGDDFFLSGNSVTDSEGNIYFTGRTTSLNFPTTPGVVSPSYNGGFDAFVVKMDPTGENIIFSTYLGGPGNDYGYSIKLIGSNNDIVIAGDASIGFPVTSGSYQTNFQGGPYDVFITRINNSGDNIVFSTFLGGPAEDQPFQIHIDNQENICIVGQTSGNFPITPNAFQTSNGGWYDIFVSKLNSSGNQLLASTYIGSTNADRGVGITSDNESNIYITGIVQGNFPTTSGAYDNTFNGGTYDIIACKFDSNLTTLLYSTYLGTSGDDIPRGEPNIDENKNLLITGKAGPGFLHQSFAFQILFGGGNSDGIVIKLSSDGSMVIHSTYLGGTGDDFIQNIEISADYQLFLTGSCGLEFPTTQCCYDNTFNGGLSDGFLTVLDTTLVQLIYSTFLGGNNIDQGMSTHLIADTVYLLGETKSPNLPTTPNALDPTYNGGYDIFLMKLLLSDGPSSIAFAGNDLTVCTDDLPVLLSEANATNALSVEWTTSGTGSFNSVGILNPVYTPSLSDINNGQVLLILTPSNGSSCEGIADTLILFIQKAALLNAGPDVTICQSGSYTISGASAQNVTSVNWTHNGNGTLLSPNTITPTYLSAPNETTDVTLIFSGIGLSPCSNEQDQLIIHIQPSPQTFAGFDDTLCSGLLPFLLQDSYIINSNNPYWTSSGTGSFSNPNTLHPTYTPSLNDLSVGSVSLTLFSSGISPCLASSDFLVLKFLSTATASAGLDATTCQNSPFTITTATASGYTSVLWSHNGQGSLSNASTLTPTYTPGVTENGIVVLTLTANGNPPCGQITNSMNLTINPSATSFAGSNASICEGSTYTLSSSNAANYTSLTWTSSGTGSFNNVSVLHPVYTPSVADIQSGNVNLTLTANSLAACQSAVSAMTLHISRQVVADAGPSASMCQSGSYVVSGSSALFYSTLSWTHTGTGTLNNSSQLHPTYVPGLNETGTITLTLTANSLTPCTPVVDQMQLTIQPAANAYAGDNATICEGGSYTLLNSTAGNYTALQWSTSGSGSYNNTGTLHPVYTPSPADIISGSVTLTLAASAVSPCPIQTSSMILSITRQPTANAGSDASICQNSSFTVSGSTAQNYVSLLWTHTGTGSFNNSSFLHPVYTPGPGESGVITLTLNGIAASPCTDVNDQMQLTIDPIPVANAGPDAAICQGTVFNVTGASAQNAIAGGISWTETGTGNLSGWNTVSPTYNPAPNETGDVYLTLEVHGALSCAGQTVMDGMILSISPFPQVGAGSNATICSANIYTLSGNAQNCTVNQWSSSGDGTFSNLNQLNAIYSPGPNDIILGIVTLTLTGTGSGACSAEVVTDQMVLSIDPMPTVFAGNDEFLCLQINNPVQILDAQSNNFSTIMWVGGDGSFNNNNILLPEYVPGNNDFSTGYVTLLIQVKGTGTCQFHSVIDEKKLFISSFPLVDAGPDDFICNTQLLYQLSGIALHANSDSINWTFFGGDGNLSAENVLDPIYYPGPVDRITIDREIHFVLSSYGVGNCHSNLVTDEFVLRIDPTPIGYAGIDDFICDERPFSLNANAQYHFSSLWSSLGDGYFSNPTSLYSNYTPGPNDVGSQIILHLDLTGCNNLAGDDELMLTVHPDPTISISGSTDICEQTSTPLTFTFTGTPPWGLTYTNGIQAVTVGGIAASPYVVNVSPNITSSYWISAASDANCTVPSDSITGLASITVNPLPSPFHMSVTHDGVFCESDSGVVIGLSGSQVGMVYQLNYNGSAVGLPYAGSGHPLIFGLFNTPGQYSVMGTNPSGNCSRSMSDTVIVIMSPTPVTDITANLPCFGDTTFFSVSGNYINKISQWLWDFGDGTYASFNTPNEPSHVYPSHGTYQVTLSVIDTNGCSYSITHPVEVRPHPNAFFSYNTPNCLGDPSFFIDLSNNPVGQGYISQWVWSYGDGTPNDTIDFPNTSNATHQYAGDGTYAVTLYITNSRNCTDIYSSTITVTRRPLAGFDFWSNCQDELAIFNDASNTNGGGAVTSWSWDFGDPASGSLNTSTLEDPTHLYTTAGLYDVTLIVQNFNGCSDTILRQVNVKGAPLADFNSTTGCLGTPTLFWADSTLINLNATATYHWDFGDGSTSNTRNTQYTYIAAGTYTVILTITDTAGCEGSRSHTLIVTPPPTALFSSATDNCQGQTISFNNQSTTETGYLTSWSWNFGDGSPVQTILFPAIPDVSHIYAVTGTFNVTLTVTNSEGCTHSYSRLVNVFGSPTADFMSSGHCKDSPVHFTDLTTTSGSQGLSTWQWNFGDPGSGVFNTSTDQNPIHSYAATGSYTVTLITLTLNGCSDTISYPVTIKPLPVTDFSFQSACQDNPALFSPAGMAIPTIASWYWSFGDGGSSTLQSPSHVYTFAGTYTVTLTVTDTAGCENQRSHPIIIVPLPLVNFDFSSPACDDQQIQFTDLTTSAAGYVTRWFWDFGDGTTQVINFPATASVSHTYAQSGTFNVTLTVKSSDSCTNLQTKTLTILPKPTALFSHGSACQGAAVSFTDLSLSNTTSGISNWQWDFGDPGSGSSNQSSQQNPIHNFNTAGTYTVRLIAIISGGCSDTTTSTVNVTPPPLVDFSSLAGCSGDTTQFTSSTAVNVNATQSWYWQFGDGLSSTLVDPIHIYAQSGTFNVMLTITDTAGCVNTKTNTVVVTPGPLSNFSFNTPACSGTEITFTDLGNGNGGIIGNWYWQFGDDNDTTFTTYHPTVTHTYSQPGTFLVSLTLGTQQGCSHTRVIPVTISASPLTAFNYQNTCQGQATQFTDQTSLNGGPTLVSHSWNFGDPPSGSNNTSTQTNPVHNYANPGTYLVRLITSNASGCQDTLEQNVSIVPKPGVDFYNDSLLCLGSATTFFTDTTATQVGAVQTYNWNFGDGSPTANTQNPQHSYGVAGTFTVILTISDTSDCQNAISHPVTIHASPQSYFTIGSACAESPTLFTDLSSAPQGDTLVAWNWDFGLAGTSDTSSLQNPQYTFNTAGTYTITLTTTTEHGCTHVKTMPLQVWNKPTAYFKYSASPCANGAVQFQDSSWSYQALVTGWNWEFEPYQYGNGQNPNHVYYAIDSCYDVKLMITDIRGCVDTAFQQVCVPSELTATFSYTQSCFGEPMQFNPQLLTPAAPADSLISFQWNFGDPQSGAQNLSTLKTPGHTFTAPGFYTINFSTTDQFGCQADDYQSVQVHALPVALFDYTPGSCDSTITFTSQSIDTASAITTMYWNFGDGTLDTINAPNTSTTHKYTTAGTYVTTLTVVDGNGCTATVTDSIRRSPCIVAAYTPSDTLLCQNYALAFSDFSTCDALISQWVWTWGDTAQPTTYNSYQSLTTHTFTQPGTFMVKLRVSTIVGGSVISDSTQRVITVIATPLAGFATQDVCYKQESMFTDTTKANGATLLTYRWEFGDPQSVYDTAVNRNPSWVYPAPGSYDPRLIVTNQSGCRDTATTNLTVHGLPSATFNSSIACVGHPTYFFDHSDPYLAPLNLWGWRVSDSLGRFLGSMQGSTPEFVFDSIGRYRVLLTASDTNQCADTLRAMVDVEPSPLSAFSYTEDVEQVQGQVQFNDGSIGADEYHWDFGNGEISPLASPLITYTEDGTYTVTLVTLNEQGCSDTTSMLYTLLFKGLYVPNAFAPGGTLQQTRIWKPVGQNLATYHCQVYNSHGAMIWESKQLDERGSPVENWDGTYKGHPVQQDVYVWKIQAIFRDGTIWNNKDVGNHDKLTEKEYGTIVLIR